MAHLRLVTESDRATATTGARDDRPRVSLRLLMAASGRCCCDDCLLAYRAGDRTAGALRVSPSRQRLTAVR